MVIPFFIQTIVDLRPKIDLGIQSPSEEAARKVTRVNRGVYEALEKANKHRLVIPNYIAGPNATSSWRPINPNHRNHPACIAYQQYETLDGTPYYLCQHGQRIR